MIAIEGSIVVEEATEGGTSNGEGGEEDGEVEGGEGEGGAEACPLV